MRLLRQFAIARVLLRRNDKIEEVEEVEEVEDGDRIGKFIKINKKNQNVTSSK